MTGLSFFSKIWLLTAPPCTCWAVAAPTPARVRKKNKAILICLFNSLYFTFHRFKVKKWILIHPSFEWDIVRDIIPSNYDAADSNVDVPPFWHQQFCGFWGFAVLSQPPFSDMREWVNFMFHLSSYFLTYHRCQGGIWKPYYSSFKKSIMTQNAVWIDCATSKRVEQIFLFFLFPLSVLALP